MTEPKPEERIPVIDAHAHLGDILYPGGGTLIDAGRVEKKFCLDLITVSEWMGHRLTWYRDQVVARYFTAAIVWAERERNFTASLANLGLSMGKAGVDYTVCLPVAPYVTFDDLKKAAGLDPRIIPFTSMDLSARPAGIAAQIAADAAAGARGLKLHSIIQKEPLNSDKTYAAVAAAAAHRLPILVHGGVSSYYFKRERHLEETGYGDIALIEGLIAGFSGASFIVGHAGLYQTKEVMSRLSGRKNVWVDISFQSSATVCKLLDAFGPERVLFASDWPFGNPGTMIRIVRAACRGDYALERMIFHDNAARLLAL